MNTSTFFNRSSGHQSSSSSVNRPSTNQRANSTCGFFGGNSSTTSPPTPDSSSSSSYTTTSTNNPTNGFNFHFEFPSINLSNLTDTFTSARFTPPNLSTLIPKQRSSSTSRNETSSSSSSPSTSTGPNNSRSAMVCENCGIKIAFFKRKKTCCDCSMDYCVNCFPKDSAETFFSLRRSRCRRCRIFNMQPLERNTLLELRIKDLKWYMDKKRIPHRFCKEKSELVDLIIRNGENGRRSYSPPNSYPTSPLNSRTTSSNTTSSNDTPSRVFRQGTDDSWVFVDPDDSGYRSFNPASQDNTRVNSNNNANGNTTNTHATTTTVDANITTTPLNNTENDNVTSNDNINNSSNSSATASRSTDHQPEETTTSKENISYDSNSSSNLNNDFKPFNIYDLTSEDQIRDLSIRQIKLLLTRNFVDFKGCCEKEELLEKAIRLWRDVNKAKERGSEDLDDDNACKICMEKMIDCVLLECGHVVTCIDCGKRMNECPICRQYVVRAVRIFKS